MKYGVFLPVSGRAASRKTLMQAAQQAESLGYDSVWAADRLVIPWKIDTAYPYSKESTFIVPPDRPFFDTLTCLAFLAGCTETIQLGMSVMVLPYRHPLHWAKIATTIDQLSTGRLIMGVGVGWMEEEFAAMNAPFKERGAVSDEQLTLLKQLWTEEHITFRGKYYNVNDIAFNPKSVSKAASSDLGGRRRQIRSAPRRSIRRCLVSLLRANYACGISGALRICSDDRQRGGAQSR